MFTKLVKVSEMTNPQEMLILIVVKRKLCLQML